MNTHKVKFTEQCLTEMVDSIFGVEEYKDPLTPEGRRAMAAYAEMVGYRQQWREYMADVFNGLGTFSVEDVKGMFGELAGQKFYRDGRHVPSPERLLIALNRSKDDTHRNSSANDDDNQLRRDIEAARAARQMRDMQRSQVGGV